MNRSEIVAGLKSGSIQLISFDSKHDTFGMVTEDVCILQDVLFHLQSPQQ